MVLLGKEKEKKKRYFITIMEKEVMKIVGFRVDALGLSDLDLFLTFLRVNFVI